MSDLGLEERVAPSCQLCGGDSSDQFEAAEVNSELGVTSMKLIQPVPGWGNGRSDRHFENGKQLRKSDASNFWPEG